MNSIKVSVITVALNSEKTIEQTINSVVHQTYDNIEYIVVDGKSTDGTLEILDRYREDIDILISEKDEGLYDAMNKGISMASGNIIGIINSDDWYEQDAIACAVENFDDNTDIIYGSLNFWDEKDQFLRVVAPLYLESLWYQMLPHPSVFVRKEIYDRYGKFDMKYKLASDYDLIFRFYLVGARFKCLNHVMANFRRGGISTTKKIECAREEYRISMASIDRCEQKDRYLAKIIDKYNGTKAYWACEQDDEQFCRMFDSVFADSSKAIVIYGAGVNGIRLAEKLAACKKAASFFVDRDENKRGTIVENIRVVSLSDVIGMDCNVIISVLADCENIYRELKTLFPSGVQIVKLYELIDDGDDEGILGQ
jgi:hypothetical protein